MKIDGLLWTEIQEIKIAIGKHKEEQWNKYKSMFKKGLSFEQIKIAKKEFDMDRNKFRIHGRCNKILEIIQKQELKIQNCLEDKK